jgi:hypothetical protein
MTEVTSVPKKSAAKKKREKASTHLEAATRLHSKIVRHQATCEVWSYFQDLYPYGGCFGDLQCAHVIRRRYSATRTDLDNALALCAKHHQYLDSHVFDLIRFVDMTRGEGTYDRLQAKADAGLEATGVSPLLFWRAERARLTRIAKERGIIL